MKWGEHMFSSTTAAYRSIFVIAVSIVLWFGEKDKRVLVCEIANAVIKKQGGSVNIACQWYCRNGVAFVRNCFKVHMMSCLGHDESRGWRLEDHTLLGQNGTCKE